jgi:hypothetical protein
MIGLIGGAFVLTQLWYTILSRSARSLAQIISFSGTSTCYRQAREKAF